MPANLTPMYHKAEREYRRATTPREQLACLENMLSLLPKHKGTDKLQADIKRKLKEARHEVSASASHATKTNRGPRIDRQGCGQVIVIGAPNAGKSQFVASLTSAKPEVAQYPYTTRTYTPGMMTFEDTAVQLIDTPPIAVGSVDPHLLNMIRSADLVALCFDASDDDAILLTADVVDALKQRKTLLVEVSEFLEGDLTMLGVCARLVVTRPFDDDAALRLDMLRELAGLAIPAIFVDHGDALGTAATKSQVFDALGVIRVFTKRPGQPVDRSDPFIVPAGATVEDVAAKVHQEIYDKLKHARLWSGENAEPQTVGREHPVQDRDIVELHV